MSNLKDKMFSYEVVPPIENWGKISEALRKEKAIVKPLKTNQKAFYFSAAAAIAILIFTTIFLVNSPAKKNSNTRPLSKNEINKNQQNLTLSEDKITVPQMNADGKFSGTSAPSEKVVIKPDSKKYVTIAGPQGQPVKISSKAATLLVASADDISKPVWSAKVNKWRDIMKTNILTPTTNNFLDIIELTHALKNY